MKNGVTVKLFLVDGTASGLKIIERSNWSGRGLEAPRSLMASLKAREEYRRAGVYLLYSSESESGLPVIYIGEGDPVGPRLDSHHREKDFWTKVVIFGRADNSLNKTHIQYLESTLVNICKSANRAKIQNGNSPALPTITDSDKAEMDEYLHNMLLLLPVLGLDIFNAPNSSKVTAESSRTDLVIDRGGANATGTELPEGFLVRKGSIAAPKEVPSCPEAVASLRKDLLDLGTIVQSPGGLEFQQDYLFTSPSLAAACILGRSSNGRVEWRTRNGVTLKEIQEKQ